MGEAPEESARCGVAKLKGDGESTKLPYTMMGGAKWVPLAYFEGEVGLRNKCLVRLAKKMSFFSACTIISMTGG